MAYTLTVSPSASGALIAPDRMRPALASFVLQSLLLLVRPLSLDMLEKLTVCKGAVVSMVAVSLPVALILPAASRKAAVTVRLLPSAGLAKLVLT